MQFLGFFCFLNAQETVPAYDVAASVNAAPVGNLPASEFIIIAALYVNIAENSKAIARQVAVGH